MRLNKRETETETGSHQKPSLGVVYQKKKGTVD